MQLNIVNAAAVSVLKALPRFQILQVLTFEAVGIYVLMGWQATQVHSAIDLQYWRNWQAPWLWLGTPLGYRWLTPSNSLLSICSVGLTDKPACSLAIDNTPTLCQCLIDLQRWHNWHTTFLGDQQSIITFKFIAPTSQHLCDWFLFFICRSTSSFMPQSFSQYILASDITIVYWYPATHTAHTKLSSLMFST